MNPTKGYYCVIQYCPDLSRLEAANIGVLLFCPEIDFLKACTDESAKRIKKFFSLSEEEKWQIDAFRISIEERLKREKQNFQSLGDLEHFIATRANAIQITAPRPMKVFDPEKDLTTLFEQLVEVPARKQEPKKAVSIKQVLSNVFKDESIKRKIRKNVRIDLPEFRPVTAPYGYQNGHFNLIQPVSFVGKDAFKEASWFAIEGEYIAEYEDPQLGKLQLNVVGQFSPEQQEAKEKVASMFARRSVALYTQDNLNDLVQDIIERGKEVAA